MEYRHATYRRQQQQLQRQQPEEQRRSGNHGCVAAAAGGCANGSAGPAASKHCRVVLQQTFAESGCRNSSRETGAAVAAAATAVAGRISTAAAWPPTQAASRSAASVTAAETKNQVSPSARATSLAATAASAVLASAATVAAATPAAAIRAAALPAIAAGIQMAAATAEVPEESKKEAEFERCYKGGESGVGPVVACETRPPPRSLLNSPRPFSSSLLVFAPKQLVHSPVCAATPPSPSVSYSPLFPDGTAAGAPAAAVAAYSTGPFSAASSALGDSSAVSYTRGRSLERGATSSFNSNSSSIGWRRSRTTLLDTGSFPASSSSSRSPCFEFSRSSGEEGAGSGVAAEEAAAAAGTTLTTRGRAEKGDCSSVRREPSLAQRFLCHSRESSARPVASSLGRSRTAFPSIAAADESAAALRSSLGTWKERGEGAAKAAAQREGAAPERQQQTLWRRTRTSSSSNGRRASAAATSEEFEKLVSPRASEFSFVTSRRRETIAETTAAEVEAAAGGEGSMAAAAAAGPRDIVGNRKHEEGLWRGGSLPLKHVDDKDREEKSAAATADEREQRVKAGKAQEQKQQRSCKNGNNGLQDQKEQNEKSQEGEAGEEEKKSSADDFAPEARGSSSSQLTKKKASFWWSFSKKHKQRRGSSNGPKPAASPICLPRSRSVGSKGSSSSRTESAASQVGGGRGRSRSSRSSTTSSISLMSGISKRSAFLFTDTSDSEEDREIGSSYSSSGTAAAAAARGRPTAATAAKDRSRAAAAATAGDKEGPAGIRRRSAAGKFSGGDRPSVPDFGSTEEAGRRSSQGTWGGMHPRDAEKSHAASAAAQGELRRIDSSNKKYRSSSTSRLGEEGTVASAGAEEYEAREDAGKTKRHGSPASSTCSRKSLPSRLAKGFSSFFTSKKKKSKAGAADAIARTPTNTNGSRSRRGSSRAAAAEGQQQRTGEDEYAGRAIPPENGSASSVVSLDISRSGRQEGGRGRGDIAAVGRRSIGEENKLRGETSSTTVALDGLPPLPPAVQMLSTKYQKLLLQQLQLMERQTQQLLTAAADAAPAFVVDNSAAAAAGEAEGLQKPLGRRKPGSAAAAAEQRQQQARRERQLQQEAARLHLLNLLLCIQRSKQALLSLRLVTATLRDEQQQLQADATQLRLWSSKHGDLTCKRDLVAYYYQQVTKASSSTIREYHQRCVLLNSDVQLLRDRIDQVMHASLVLLTNPPSLASLYRPGPPRASQRTTRLLSPAAADSRAAAPGSRSAAAAVACRRGVAAAGSALAASTADAGRSAAPAAAREDEEGAWLAWLQRLPGMADTSAAVLRHFAADPRVLRLAPPFLSQLRLYSVEHVYPSPVPAAAASGAASAAGRCSRSSRGRGEDSGPFPARTEGRTREAAAAAKRTERRAAEEEAEGVYDWSHSSTLLLPVSPAAALPQRACVRSVPPGLLLRSSAADLQRVEQQLEGKWGSYKLYESWIEDAMRWQWRDAVNMREYCSSRQELFAWREQLSRRMRQAIDLRLKQLWLGRMRGLHAEALQQFRSKIAALLLPEEKDEEAEEATTAACAKASQAPVKKTKKQTQESDILQQQQDKEKTIRRGAAADRTTEAVTHRGGRGPVGRRSSTLEKNRGERERVASGKYKAAAAAASPSSATLRALRLFSSGAVLWYRAAVEASTEAAAGEEGGEEIGAAYTVVGVVNCYRSMENALLAAEDMRGQVLRVTRTVAYTAAAAATERWQQEGAACDRQEQLKQQICRVQALLSRLQEQQVQLEVEEDAAHQPEVLEEECAQAEAAAALLQKELQLLQEKRGMRQQQLLDARVSAQAKLLQITALFDKEQDGLRIVEHDWAAMQQIAKDIEVLLVEKGALRMQELADAAADAQQQRDAARARLQEALDQLQSFKMKSGLRKLQAAAAKKEEKERKKEKEAADVALAAAQRARLVAEREAATQKRQAEETAKLLRLQIEKCKELEAAAAAAAAREQRRVKEERTARGRAAAADEEEKEDQAAVAGQRKIGAGKVKEKHQEGREPQKSEEGEEAGVRAWGSLFHWPTAYRRARSTPAFRRNQTGQENETKQQQEIEGQSESREGKSQSELPPPRAAAAVYPSTTAAAQAGTQDEGAGGAEPYSRRDYTAEVTAEEDKWRSAADAPGPASHAVAAAAVSSTGTPSLPLDAHERLAGGWERRRDGDEGEAAAAVTESVHAGEEQAAYPSWLRMETEQWERWDHAPSFSDMATSTSTTTAPAATATFASRASAAASTPPSSATTSAAVALWSPSSSPSSGAGPPFGRAAAASASAATSSPCAALPGSSTTSSFSSASSTPAFSPSWPVVASLAASASGEELKRSCSVSQPKARRWLRRPLSALIGKESAAASSIDTAAAAAAVEGDDTAADGEGGGDGWAAKKQHHSARFNSFSCPSSPPDGEEGRQQTAARGLCMSSSEGPTAAAAAWRLRALTATAAGREETTQEQEQAAGKTRHREAEEAAAAVGRGEGEAAHGMHATSKDAAAAAGGEEERVRVEEDVSDYVPKASARHATYTEEEEKDRRGGEEENNSTAARRMHADVSRYSSTSFDPPSASLLPFLSWHEGISRDGGEEERQHEEGDGKPLLHLGSTDNWPLKYSSLDDVPSSRAAAAASATSCSPGTALSPGISSSPAASSTPAAASPPAAPSSPSARGRKKKGIGGAYGLLLRSISFSPATRRMNSTNEDVGRQHEPQRLQQQQKHEENLSRRGASSSRISASASPPSVAPLRRPEIFSSREAALKAAALRRAQAEAAAAAGALRGKQKHNEEAEEEERGATATAAAGKAEDRHARTAKEEGEGRESEEERRGVTPGTGEGNGREGVQQAESLFVEEGKLAEGSNSRERLTPHGAAAAAEEEAERAVEEGNNDSRSLRMNNASSSSWGEARQVRRFASGWRSDHKEPITRASPEDGFSVEALPVEASPRHSALRRRGAAAEALTKQLAPHSGNTAVRRGEEGDGEVERHRFDEDSCKAFFAAAVEENPDAERKGADAAVEATPLLPGAAADHLLTAATAASPAAASVGYKGPFAADTVASIPAEPPLFSSEEEEEEEEMREGQRRSLMNGAEAEADTPGVRTLEEHREEPRNAHTVEKKAPMYLMTKEKNASFERFPRGVSTPEGQRVFSGYEQGDRRATHEQDWALHTVHWERRGVDEGEGALRSRQGSRGEEMLQHQQQQYPWLHSRRTSRSSSSGGNSSKRSRCSSAYSSTRR